MRLYMKFRQTNPTTVAAAKASISIATAYRIEMEPKAAFAEGSTRTPANGSARGYI
jgi:hypothetical protein